MNELRLRRWHYAAAFASRAIATSAALGAVDLRSHERNRGRPVLHLSRAPARSAPGVPLTGGARLGLTLGGRHHCSRFETYENKRRTLRCSMTRKSILEESGIYVNYTYYRPPVKLSFSSSPIAQREGRRRGRLDMVRSKVMTTTAGETSTAWQRRRNTSIVGEFLPASSMLTYSRDTPARTPTSSWVRPALSLSFRSSFPNTPGDATRR